MKWISFFTCSLLVLLLSRGNTGDIKDVEWDLSVPLPLDVREAFFWSPKDGFVPDSVTACKVAEAIWLPIYGDAVLLDTPFIAQLAFDSIWMVRGTTPEGRLGGDFYIEIGRHDGRILFVARFK